MKRTKQKILLLALCVIVILIGGCQEQLTANPAQTRLIAEENRQLKARSAQLEKKIAEQKKLLENCRTQKQTLQAKLKEKVDKQVESILAVLMNESAQLQREVNNLQKELELCKKR